MKQREKRITKPNTLGAWVTNLVIPCGEKFRATLDSIGKNALANGLSRAEYVRRALARSQGTAYPGVK